MNNVFAKVMFSGEAFEESGRGGKIGESTTSVTPTSFLPWENLIYIYMGL